MKTKHARWKGNYAYGYFFLLLGLLINSPISAGEKTYPVSLSFLNESWAFPGSEITRLNPLYPGLMAGISRQKTDKLFSFPQSAQLGFFYNTQAGSAVFLFADQGLRIAPKLGLFLEFSVGLGYFHAFHPDPVYRKKDSGIYEEHLDLGKASAMFSFSQTLGYDLTKKTSLPLAPFIKFQWIASYPYFDMMMPIRPSNLVHIGTLIYL